MPPHPGTESDLTFPKDLLSEIQRQLPACRDDFQVESWQPSLVARMLGFLDRGRSRE